MTLILESIVAMRRIEKFLKAEEIDTSYIQYHESSEADVNAIVIKNGEFFWVDETEKSKEKKKVEGKKKVKEKKKIKCQI